MTKADLLTSVHKSLTNEFIKLNQITMTPCIQGVI